MKWRIGVYNKKIVVAGDKNLVGPNEIHISKAGKSDDNNEKPEEGAKLINFTVDGVEYQTEEGMTWEQYCGSKYNTLGCFLVDGDDAVYTIYEDNGGWDYQYEYILYDGLTVSRSDIIIPNALYYLLYEGLGGGGGLG